MADQDILEAPAETAGPSARERGRFPLARLRSTAPRFRGRRFPGPRFRVPRPAGRWRWRILAVAVVAVAVAVAGALLFGMQSPMQIRAVQIDGASTDLAPQVAAALAVAPGQSFSSVDTGAAEARIEAIDGIRGANLGWSWWNRLTVDVHEQTPAALVAGPDGAFVVIDAHGVPIRTAAARPAGLPVVQAGSDAERATALAVVAAMPPAVLAAADTVVVHGTADLQVVLANGSTVILGGTDGLAHKLLLAGQLAATNAKQINVSVPDRPALQGVPAPPPAR